MGKKSQPNGFSVVWIIIVVAVFATIGVTGWYVWHKNKKDDPDSTSYTTQTNTINNNPKGFQTPSGWTWYENKDMGIKFAFPSSWSVGEPTPIATTSGEQGLYVTTKPQFPANGDPSITFSTYPANATIRNVDAGSNDVKVRDITTPDKTTFTLMGTIEGSNKATKPTQMYASSCWPRNCTLKLLNGRYLGVAVGSINNDCQPKVYCPTEINTSSDNYSVFINVLNSITSL